MPLSAASRRDGDSRCGRHRAPSDGERPRCVRERLDLLMSVLGELEYLRHRQELLVLSALREEVKEVRSNAQLNSEENILVLRKQLSCLRRDAGVISELHELDQQIGDLRLDVEVSHDQPETDSRPSSGFYELSDGASGSLSNSSHSVFSECFCSTAEAEGYFLSTEELASCLEYDVLVGGLCDDSGSSGAVRRSLSAPQQAPLEATSLVSTDQLSKNFGNVFSRHVNDTYSHQRPLHPATIQCSGLLQISCEGGHCREDAGVECFKIETASIPSSVSGPPGLQSSTLQTQSSKHLEKYIFGLLQRRAQPIRANRPRTSISTDPLKSIVRQPSLCLRQVSGSSSSVGTLKGSETKYLFPVEESPPEVVPVSSSQRQCAVESKNEEKGILRVLSGDTDIMQVSSKINNSDSLSPASENLQNNRSVNGTVKNTSTKRVISKTCKGSCSLSGASVPSNLKDIRDQRSTKLNSSHKETGRPCCPTEQEQMLKLTPTAKTKTGPSKRCSKTLQSKPLENSEPVPTTTEPFTQKLVEGVQVVRSSHVGNCIPAKQPNGKHCKLNCRNVKVTKVKGINRTNTRLASDIDGITSENRDDRSHHNSGFDRFLQVEDGNSSPITGVPDKHSRPTQIIVRSGVSKHHQHGSHHSQNRHGREQVVFVAKPKYKRKDYRPLSAIMEVPCDSGNKHTRLRQRRRTLKNSVTKTNSNSGGQQRSPYSSVAGSDSEYSAECVSLFHSTIVDTSEDDRSNYTTNCFGDSESSEEYVEENTTTSDTEESVGGRPGGHGPGRGGAGRHRGQPRTAHVRVGKLETDSAQIKAFVKIKASHNLKRKILRFRSGSLKLMTTV